MAQPVVVLAERGVHARLRRERLLASLLETRGEPGDEAALRHIHPGDLTGQPTLDKGAETPSPTTLEEIRDRRLAECLGSVVCHVAVINEGTGPAEISAWYDTFLRESEARMGYRKDEYRHVLVLVVEQQPARAKELLALIHRLTGHAAEAEPVIDACYVMLPRLNLGARQVLHARHVWPACVARLLLYLAQGAGAVRARGGRAPILAWRSIALALDEAHLQAEALPELDGLPSAWTRLTEEAAERTPPLPDTPRGPLVKRRQITGPAPVGARVWQSYNPKMALQQALHGEHWSAQRLMNAEQLAASALFQPLTHRDPARVVDARVWPAVHEQAAIAEPTLRASAAQMASESARRRRASAEGGSALSRLSTMLQAREVSIEEADACAEHLDRARFGFVSQHIRFAGMAFPAAALTAYVAAMSLQPFGGATWIWAAGAAVLGAFGAGLTSWLLERHAGERAKGVFQDKVVAGLVRDMIQLDDDTQVALITGRENRLASDHLAALHRIRAMLDRLLAMLRAHLGARPTGGAMDTGSVDPGNASTDPDTNMRAQQQAAYARATRIVLVPHELTGVTKELERRFKEALDQFRASWPTRARTWDPKLFGSLAVRELAPWLDQWESRLRAVAPAALGARAAASFKDEAPWIDDLHTRLEETHLYFMSCAVTDDTCDLSARQRELLLRPPMAGPPRDVFPFPSRHARWLESLPLLGLHHDQVPVDLHVTEAGALEVSPHVG